MKPLPPKIGIGYTSPSPVKADGFRYEQVGRYHNYYVTEQGYDCPTLVSCEPCVIDGFSPNLNKQLHVGHLRNLALARAIQGLHPKAKMVAMLGASLGIKPEAVSGWKDWTDFVGYLPTPYYDTALSYDGVDIRPATPEDELDLSNGIPWVWDGPHGPVIVKRADGTPLYALHDLAFAKQAAPDFYFTGHEQREHFKNLGFESKHAPMGLVLGADGKKLKSRDGTALLATDALQLVQDNLQPTAFPKEVAWNILCWNFLHVSRSQDLKFEVEKWCSPDSAGMYITYTYARIFSIVKDLDPEYDPAKARPIDYELMGYANQFDYWQQQVIERLDPASFANHAHDVARKLGEAYQQERIKDGRSEFQYAVKKACLQLGAAMEKLGMFPLGEV